MLKNPFNSRIVSSLPLPPHMPLQSTKIYNHQKINWRQILRFLQREGKIQINDFKNIIQITTEILKNQPNLITIQDPLTIVGDIHGQFYDFIQILKQNCGGDPEKTKYLFLGDYIDRGSFSIQVLIILFSLKISYPKSIILLRGNHECRQLTSYFSFKIQCLTKYNQEIYDLIMQLFDCLPLACLVNGKFLCVHGGISHELQNLRDILKINRFQQIPKIGLFCDLLWADPTQDPQGKTEKLIKPNHVRGCSYYFGNELCSNFMKKNRIISIIRAHEAQLEGFKLNKWSGSEKIPAIITIFSAPNYCDFYKNKGAIILFKKGIFNIQQFYYTPHPYILPHFMDIFQWSIPFVAQKIAQMLYHVIKPNEEFQQQQKIPFQLLNKRETLQQLLIKQKQTANNNLKILNLLGLCPDRRLIQTEKYQRDLDIPFEKKRLIDLQNQHFPISQNN